MYFYITNSFNVLEIFFFLQTSLHQFKYIAQYNKNKNKDIYIIHIILKIYYFNFLIWIPKERTVEWIFLKFKVVSIKVLFIYCLNIYQ